MINNLFLRSEQILPNSSIEAIHAVDGLQKGVCLEARKLDSEVRTSSACAGLAAAPEPTVQVGRMSYFAGFPHVTDIRNKQKHLVSRIW